MLSRWVFGSVFIRASVPTVVIEPCVSIRTVRRSEFGNRGTGWNLAKTN